MSLPVDLPPPPPSPLAGGLRRIITAAAFVWSAAGIVVLIAATTLLTRAGLQSATPQVVPADHPYAAAPWFPGYQREFVASLRMRWESYVYWRRHAFAGRDITVGTDGLRRTVQANTRPATRRVWLFGGSTVWGTWQRDSMTMASQLARALAARGLDDVEVVNYGETGWVSTQELLQLLLELRRGARPDVVAFGDGTADLAAAAESGQCADPQNEHRRRIEFAIGRVLTRRTMRDAIELTQVARERLRGDSAGVPRIRSKRDEAAVDLRPLVHSVLGCYGETMRLSDVLARAYGFVPFYFWQPSPFTSRRALTPFELAVTDTMSVQDLFPYIRVLTRLAADEVDSALVPRAPGRFINLTRLFDGDTTTTFLDYVGHMTERGAGRVADAMAGPIAAALQRDRSQNWK